MSTSQIMRRKNNIGEMTFRKSFFQADNNKNIDSESECTRLQRANCLKWQMTTARTLKKNRISSVYVDTNSYRYSYHTWCERPLELQFNSNSQKILRLLIYPLKMAVWSQFFFLHHTDGVALLRGRVKLKTVQRHILM